MVPARPISSVATWRVPTVSAQESTGRDETPRTDSRTYLYAVYWVLDTASTRGAADVSLSSGVYRVPKGSRVISCKVQSHTTTATSHALLRIGAGDIPLTNDDEILLFCGVTISASFNVGCIAAS